MSRCVAVNRSAAPSQSGAEMIDLNTSRSCELRTVLVVDDTRLIRQLISSFVERMGFTAIEAENGWEAWQLILQDVPNLIITDIEMPICDGLQLIRQVRTSHDVRVRPIPIFVCSSITSQLGSFGSLSGVQQIMHKPLNVKRLHQCLQSFSVDTEH